MGSIYCVENKSTGLKYIGGTKTGVQDRWRHHIRDAKIEKNKNLNCSLFHQAINTYGEDNFIVSKLKDCLIEEIDTFEQQYIAENNTIHPNGYNMSIGGKNTKFGEKARENMSSGQIGKRYTHTVERKNAADKDLPRYISAIRENGRLKGYQIKKFPMGIDDTKYVYKTFKRINNPASGLEEAKVYLEGLTAEYARLLEIKNQEKGMVASSSNMIIPSLPKYVYSIIDNGEIKGYYVKDMKDYGNNLIPRKDFDNLTAAVNYINEIEEANLNQKLVMTTLNPSIPSETEALPANIYKSTYKGIHNGYRVKLLTGYNNEGGKKKPIYAEKNFTGPKKTMPEKLQLAIEYIESINLN
jgi:hypothetical protein